METPLHLPQQQETVLLSLPGLLQTPLKCAPPSVYVARVSPWVCVWHAHADLCVCCANVLCEKV